MFIIITNYFINNIVTNFKIRPYNFKNESSLNQAEKSVYI